MRQTEIIDINRFRDTLQKAKELGGESRNTLIDCLKRLNEIRKVQGYTLIMYPDFVKYSWGFTFFRNGIRNFNGGMILHGFEQTFSVEVDSVSYPHWSLHT